MLSPKVKHTLLWILAAFAGVFVIAGALLAYGASKAGYWLEEAAQAPEKADAIVVLGGDNGERSLKGAALYRDGFAPLIVLTGLEKGNATPPARLTWRADYLAAHGVPRSVLRFEVASKNSYEEATNVLALMQKQKWKRVIVVSDPPHMRRLAWTWNRIFKGSGLHYVLVPSAAEWWIPGEWWRDELSGSFVITEYIKLAYYILKR